MSTKHFSVIQSAMSQTADVICTVHGISRTEAFTRIEQYIKQNSTQWRLDAPQIDYQDAFCRMAYLYMNVAVHATLVEKALRSFSISAQTIRQKAHNSDTLRVVAFGGGPGSELLGLVRYIELANLPPIDLDMVLVDSVKEWDESWHALKLGVDGQFRAQYGVSRAEWPILISKSFIPLDITERTDFESFATRFSETDIYLFCYVVSEVKAKHTGFHDVLRMLVQRARPGSLFLFIDRTRRWCGQPLRRS